MADRVGYCLAYRKAWEHPAFKNLREAAIWNFLYQNAKYEDGEQFLNGHTFQLKRGQVAISIASLAQGFCMTSKGVQVVIRKLEKLKMTANKGTNKGTIITICNYEDFQLKGNAEGQTSGKPRANQGQTKGKPYIVKETNKTINKENTPPTPKGEFNFIKYHGIRLNQGSSRYTYPDELKYFEKHKEEGEKAYIEWKKEINSKRN